MGREAQPRHSRLMPRLEADLPRINFYRFCQLLERQHPDKPLLGATSHPADDPVRFHPHPGMGFPASELRSVEYDEANDSGPPVIRTTFMGLYGVDSPLPTAWLDDIAQRREGHEALQGVLDIFSHRIITQYYRLWRKYCWPATFEPGGTDRLSQSLLGLAGLGHPRHDAAYRLASVALSGADWRAASAGQNSAGDPGADHAAGPEDHRQGEPLLPASGGDQPAAGLLRR